MTDHDAPTDPAPPLSLGERCVEWCRARMAEEPIPSRTTLASWFAPVNRGLDRMVLSGQRLNHCAATQCAAALACAAPGEAVPHEYRAGARQLMLDAIKAHCWHQASEVRAGAWRPSIGDLAIYDRYNPSNPKSERWHAHVDRVMAVHASNYEAIGANEGPGGAWRVDTSMFSQPNLLGFIAYPAVQAGALRDEHVSPRAGHILTEEEIAYVEDLVNRTLDQAEASWWLAERATVPDREGVA